jgi:hypothetical protein
MSWLSHSTGCQLPTVFNFVTDIDLRGPLGWPTRRGASRIPEVAHVSSRGWVVVVASTGMRCATCRGRRSRRDPDPDGAGWIPTESRCRGADLRRAAPREAAAARRVQARCVRAGS